MKLVYIIHPLTTGKASLVENLARLSEIKLFYQERELGEIAIFPHEILRGKYPLLGDQGEAYEASKAILMRCEAAHDWSRPHHRSIGCEAEMSVATECGIAVRSMGHVSLKDYSCFPTERFIRVRNEEPLANSVLEAALISVGCERIAIFEER